MDKNFIKIDDLVRQRLTGVEEKERSGAWMNMRDLLDKEMPQQKRISIFYWRRIFSAVAVLSLLGSVCIGGMELSAYYNNADSGHMPIAAVEVGAGNDNATMLISEGNTDAATNTATTPNTSKHIAANVDPTAAYTANAKDANTIGVSNKKQKTDNASAGMNNTVASRHVTANNGAASTSGLFTKTENQNQQSKSDLNRTNHTNNTTTQTGTVRNTANNTTAGNRTTTKIATANTANNPSNNNGNKGNESLKTNDNQPANSVAKNDIKNETNSAANVTTDADNKKVDAALNATDNMPVAAVATKENIVHPARPAAQNEAKLDVLNSGAPSATMPNNVAAKATDIPEMKGSVDAPQATTATEKTKESIKNDTPATNTAAVTNSRPANSPVAKNNTATGVKATATKNTTATAANKAKKGTEPASTGGVAVKNNAENPNNTTSKKVITKIQVHQRTIMLAANVYGNRIDTISIEKVNVDLGYKVKGKNNEEETTVAKAKNNTAGGNSETENKPSASKGGKTGRHAATPGTMTNVNKGNLTPAAKAGKGAMQNNSNDPSSLSANQNEQQNSTEEESYEEIVAGAAPASKENETEAANAATEATTATATAKVAEQEHKGMSMMKKLSAAFNDVKESASRAHLVGGVSAGINSNFFGPNSFKGFQFGMTANLIFNDTWNIMTEMKYFHRLNNNKSIEDNYFTYTPTSGSQYSRQLQMNSYSFSALHSIEMPVAIRYAKGKFNFYGGGNFLYSFSINTGAETIPAYNVAPTLVNEVGPDNTPKLKEEDFRSRFGIGYLFGFSYKLAPNANIDFRTVQTLLENTNSAGARTISGQLYRAPSLQLSIMYRLGGNRHAD